MRTQKLQLVDYDPNWADLFHKEVAILSDALGLSKECFHHVGSTSIPEIKAKPIIDICCELTSYPPDKKTIEALVRNSYEPQGECGVPNRFWLTKGSPRKFHLHLTPRKSSILSAFTKFRDELRKNSDLRDEYQNLKMKFQNHFELDSHEYNLSKQPFIEKVLKSKS